MVQRRKVHQFSKVLHGVVQLVNRLWERNPKPYRIVLLNREHSIIAKADREGQINADFERLTRLFGASPPPTPGGRTRAAYQEWKRSATAQILRFAGNPGQVEREILASRRQENKRAEGRGDAKAGKDKVSDGPGDVARKFPALATVEDSWKSLMDRSFDLGKYAMEIGVLPQSDLEEFSPYLYLGLPALTILQAVIRSQGKGGIVLKSGQVLVADYIPKEAKDLRAMFADLEQTRKDFERLQCSPEELDQLHRAALFAGESEGFNVKASPERVRDINKVVAGLTSIAIRLSQMKFFLNTFNNVITRLSDIQIQPKLRRTTSWLGAIQKETKEGEKKVPQEGQDAKSSAVNRDTTATAAGADNQTAGPTAAGPPPPTD